MTSISSVSSSFQTQTLSRPGKGQDRMFQKADTDGSGGVDSTELQTLLDHVAKKTGVSLDVSSQELLTQADANSDGTLDSTELKTAMESILPPPSTMDFAQSRGASGKGQAGDDLFSKVDADGSGELSSTELQTMLDHMSSQHGATTSSSSSTTSTDSSNAASDMLKQLDTDGNGSLSQAEFDAGRPSGPPMEGMGGHMPPPPPMGMDSTSSTSTASSSGTTSASTAASGTTSASDSTTYDSADLNKDGVVSAQEKLLANAQQAFDQLVSQADSDGDQKLSGDEWRNFIQQLAQQYVQVANGGVSTTTGSTVNTSA